MRTVSVGAERAIAAPADRVYGLLADYADHHHRFLPAAFSNYEVEAGGVGEGTTVRFRITAAGRSRDYRVGVTEPDPGRVLAERSLTSNLETTFTVTPRPRGCVVRIETCWEDPGGLWGFVERLLAPRVVGGLYADELARLEAYALSFESTGSASADPGTHPA